MSDLNIMGFWWTFFSGHFSIGRLTFFGANAMHWSMIIYGTRWGVIHIDLPTLNRIIGKKSWCVYASPNSTPWACTWYIGNRDPKEKIRAKIRKHHFGHNCKMVAGQYKEGSELYELNQVMDILFWRDGIKYLKMRKIA